MSDEKADSAEHHTLGTYAYERVLREAESRKVTHLQRKLQPSLDGTIHVWVRDARPFAHYRDSTMEPLELRLHLSLPVTEVRDRIQEHYEQESSYREHNDGSLQLFFNGRVLEDGKLLAEYFTRNDDLRSSPKRLDRWPAPFGGILWVIPFRPASKVHQQSWGG